MVEQKKLVIRKLPAKKPELPTPEQEEAAVKTAIDVVLQAIREGEFDAHLDLLDEMLTARISQYQQETGDPVERRPVSTADKIRSMRSESVQPKLNERYYLRGEKYTGVLVRCIDLEPGSDKVLIECESVGAGTASMVYGKKYKVPVTALMEIPEVKKIPEAVSTNTYRRTVKCMKCGDPIEYSGRGRPKKLCSTCEFHKN